MNFARPETLWLLGILPLLLTWGMRSARLRRRGWEAMAQRGRPPGDGTAWWIGSAACAILALAQPRWGLDRSDRLPPGHDVVLLVDVSRSMGAEDAVPSRLGVARESARSLIEALAKTPGNRVAVVAFAGRGVLRCPLTENSGAALDALGRLKPGDVRPGGTDLGAGLIAAVDAFDRQEHEDGRTILVLSDGEDLAGRWERTMPADRLRKERVIVHAIAIGDPEKGHAVPVRAAEAKGAQAGPSSKTAATPTSPASAATSRPLTYRGEPVLSRRVDSSLEAIAKWSGGTIIRLGLASANLGELYTSRIEPVALRTRAEMRIAERIDRFPLPLMAALGLGLMGCRPRRSRMAPTRHRPRSRRVLGLPAWLLTRLVRVGGLRATRAAGAAMLMLTVIGAGDAKDGARSASRAIADGIAAYRDGRFQEALAAFEAAARREPMLAVPRYNAAAVLYRLEQYAEAHAGYLEARERAGPALRTKIDFALGNSALASGDIVTAIGHYDDCLASAAPGDDLDAVRRDAAINREFAVERAKSIGDDQAPRQSRPRQDGRDRGRPDPDGSDEDPSANDGDRGDDPDGPDPDDDPDAPPGGRRRAGGAGGEGGRDRANRDDPGSPDRKLDAAMDQIRDARRRRLPDDAPPPDSGTQDDGRDW